MIVNPFDALLANNQGIYGTAIQNRIHDNERQFKRVIARGIAKGVVYIIYLTTVGIDTGIVVGTSTVELINSESTSRYVLPHFCKG